jgi:hypothetical protein
MRLINELQILYYENMIRFITEDAAKIINIDKDFSVEERVIILSGANYTKFNTAALFKPGYCKAKDIREKVFGKKASYDYIDRITVGDKSKAGLAKLIDKLEELKAEADRLNNTSWSSIWKEEIGYVEEAIKKGIETNWLFSTKQHVFKTKK